MAAQYTDNLHPFILSAYKELNPENEQRLISEMFQLEARARIAEQCCSSAGFHMKYVARNMFSKASRAS